MLVFNPSNPDIVKNYFLNEGDKGLVFKVEEKDIDSIPLNMLNYISQIEVGSFNMNKRFSPGKYIFIWVEFSKYIHHLFISEVSPNISSPIDFFLYKYISVKFNDTSGITVW